eukprot:6211537-Karenia_brevis.AAC.1
MSSPDRGTWGPGPGPSCVQPFLAHLSHMDPSSVSMPAHIDQHPPPEPNAAEGALLILLDKNLMAILS